MSDLSPAPSLGRSPQAGWNRAGGKGLIPRKGFNSENALKQLASLN